MPAPWPEQQLPPLINGVAEVAALREYHKLVKEAGKHARERMHHLVLYNIRNLRKPNILTEGTIPHIKRLVYWWPGNAHAHWVQCWQRREAIWIFQAARQGEGRPDIWARVDRQLHKLRVKGPLFYRLVYNGDLASFVRTVHITQIDPLILRAAQAPVVPPLPKRPDAGCPQENQCFRFLEMAS
ncbi:hypothetical protein DFH28DRAFT_924351 [Melampsora americana]|nr:hypothetical protein DFH28DRAFT_924351 [Melampsora americana]